MAGKSRTKSRTKARNSAQPEAISEAIEDVAIDTVMQESYQDYAASVVVGRAIADVRDGLKPVHRRILYTMKVGRYDWTSNYRKTARIVGDCLGVFHPHGDGSVADALARLTQPWSMGVPLIDGQGNFGSPDGDGPAAMRYTEARLAPVARFLLEEIDRDTVDFRPNYDETDSEPVVLPAAFPNALVNGGSGIAVGMAAAIPPHNLGDVVAATRLRLRDPDASLDALRACLPGPDFPTGGRILGTSGIEKAYRTGRGSVVVEATTHFERDGKTPLIVYTDMPWGKTRPDLLARINALMGAGALDDVVSARDETDRQGPRFVVELRPGADPDHADRQLKAQTDLRTSIGLNFTLLDGRGVPREMGLADILDEWIAFRRQTLRRRALFDLRQARARGRLLLGRMAALSVIDRVVKLIRGAADREAAITAICALSFQAADYGDLVALLGTSEQARGKRFRLTRGQAEDILAMRLQRLTGLERDALEKEAHTLVDRIRSLQALLADPDTLDAQLADELDAVAAAHATPRRTDIDAQARPEDLRAATTAPASRPVRVLEMEDGTWAVASGKIGRAPGIRRRLDSETGARLVAFSARGTAYGLDVSALPDLSAKATPRALPGLLGLTPDSEIVATLPLSPEALAQPDAGGATLVFVSRDGMVRRTAAAEFARIPSGGKIAMKIAEQDPDILAVFAQSSDTATGGGLFMANDGGRVLRFGLDEVRIFGGRASRGVRGMKIGAQESVIAAFEVPRSSLRAEECDAIEAAWLGKGKARSALGDSLKPLLDGPEIVQVSETGQVRRTLLAAYREMRRDGRGLNDKGPAKTIGAITRVGLARAGELPIGLLEGDVTLDSIRRGPRASTGRVPG